MARCSFKMVKWIQRAGILAAAMALIGCSSVTARHPVGQPLDAKSKVDLSGAWRVGDGSGSSIWVVKQLPGGVLRLAMPQWKEDKFQLVRLKGLITVDDGAYYVNLLPPQPPDSTKPKPRYGFARLIIRSNHDDHGRYLLLVPANVSYFEAEVKSGRLAGHVQKSDSATTVELDADQHALNALIQPDLIAKQFQLDHTLVLKRVTP